MALYEPTIIDLLPADNGAYRTQEQWIAFFNEQRKRMISAADLYQAGKFASDEQLKSLRDGFNVSWLVSSTRIGYSGDGLSGRITQNYGSIVVTPSQTDVPVIPIYKGTLLAQALQTKEGIDYLQAVFDTNDNHGTIEGTLEHLSGRDADNIILWTTDQNLRKRDSQRAVGFIDGGIRFHVGGLFFDVDVGRSREASVSPRSGRAKK